MNYSKSNVSDMTIKECADIFIRTINPESININELIINSGLSKNAIKEILCLFVDNYIEGNTVVNDDIPDLKLPDIDKFVYTLRNEYGLTYSLARKILQTYEITDLNQLCYLSDDDFRLITGVGDGSLAMIRKSFPYKQKTVKDALKVSVIELHLPTKIETQLSEKGVFYMSQLSDFMVKDYKDLGYPECLLLEAGWHLYLDGIKDPSDYIKSYYQILLQSFDRNLGNIVRHSDSSLNLYWLDEVIYTIITYTYELMHKDSKYEIIKTFWNKFEGTREELITYCRPDDDTDNQDIINHYKYLYQSMSEIFADFMESI